MSNTETHTYRHTACGTCRWTIATLAARAQAWMRFEQHELLLAVVVCFGETNAGMAPLGLLYVCKGLGE